MVSREGDDKDSDGVKAEVVGERQDTALAIESGEGIGEAWDNGTGLIRHRTRTRGRHHNSRTRRTHART